jgi:1-phosphofructokinase
VFILIFDFFDFITLDDGERPILNLIQHLEGKRSEEELKRTFLLQKGLVKYIDGAKEKEAKVILDSSGEEFKLALKKSPYLVKPNLEEIENLLGRKINNKCDLKNGAEYLLKQGVEIVMISLGAKGAFIASEAEGYRIYTPQVKVSQTTVGAGDTMVAGLAAEIDKNESLKETGVFAAALATAFVESGSISKIDEKLIERIKNSIKVEKVY